MNLKLSTAKLAAILSRGDELKNDDDVKDVVNKMGQSYIRYWKNDIGNVTEQDMKETKHFLKN